jgi:hypothetical protein
MKMIPNKERIKLWLDALVSGEFGQGTGFLRQGPNEYCCLGVACVVANRNGGPYDGRIDDVRNGGHPRFKTNEWYGVALSGVNFTRKELGIGDDHPRLENEGDLIGAISLNDGAKWSFRQIAEAFAKKFDIEITYPEVSNVEA